MKEDSLDLLIHRLFEGELTREEETELNVILVHSPEARQRYVRASGVHAALCRLATSTEQVFSIPPQAIPVRSTFSWLGLAACITLGLGALVFYVANARQTGLATIAESRDLVWKEGSVAPESGRISKGESFELIQGYLRLVYPTGATATLEGPCRFVISAPEAITVLHGRISVHAPPGAQGFIVDTPGGRFVDLGTEFGLAVGSDGETPVVLTEVFKGEVEVQATGTPTRLVKGESRALIQDLGHSTLVSSLDEAPITLVNHARELPEPAMAREESANLALGKPVASPGYYTRKHGSTFPPDRLTDGRLNDSGVPGDWSFWLAPNEQDGEFTVDLLQPERVGRISLQNTNNRSIGDRGVASFEVYGSLDNREFIPLTQGELPRIDPNQGSNFPFHDFTFPSAQARYLKLVVTRHYRHPERPPSRKDHSGGLNEIRIFSR